MRLLFLLTILLLSSCENQKDKIANRRQTIKKEIDQIKAVYYKKSDSLGNIKKQDTSSAKQLEIAEALASADKKRIVQLIPLQRAYDSLEIALKK